MLIMTCNLCIIVKVTGKPKTIENETGGKFRNFAEIAGGGNMQAQYAIFAYGDGRLWFI